MKLTYYLVLTAIGIGLTSCYGMTGVGLNAAYIQSNTDNSDTSDAPTSQVYQLRDTVYLKDGSIIHGFIIQEQPGISLQIKTKSGNVYTYQMVDVAKITHSASSNDDSMVSNNTDDSGEQK
jgi:hypothetical protein